MLAPERRVHSLPLTQMRSKDYFSSGQVHLLAGSPSPLVNIHLAELLQHKTLNYQTDKSTLHWHLRSF